MLFVTSLGFLGSRSVTARWFQVPVASIDEADVGVWPFSVSLLVKVVRFLGTLHWPGGMGDLGIGGVSYLELLILYELWAGEKASA